mmetsp:Transcript_11147/g.22146  ORF Transcript_11147/g.22146 Transcript_11147/m.22146 type:complete len:314 (-) Transcript_11147:957-1898(-)
MAGPQKGHTHPDAIPTLSYYGLRYPARRQPNSKSLLSDLPKAHESALLDSWGPIIHRAPLAMVPRQLSRSSLPLWRSQHLATSHEIPTGPVRHSCRPANLPGQINDGRTIRGRVNGHAQDRHGIPRFRNPLGRHLFGFEDPHTSNKAMDILRNTLSHPFRATFRSKPDKDKELLLMFRQITSRSVFFDVLRVFCSLWRKRAPPALRIPGKKRALETTSAPSHPPHPSKHMLTREEDATTPLIPLEVRVDGWRSRRLITSAIVGFPGPTILLEWIGVWLFVHALAQYGLLEGRRETPRSLFPHTPHCLPPGLPH